MSHLDYSPLIQSLFLDNPDCYNRSVPVLLKILRAKLSFLELEEVLETVKNQLEDRDRDTEGVLSREFNLFLIENKIEEGLRGYKTMRAKRAAYELTMLEVKIPDGIPVEDFTDFWDWFESLPELIRKKVWDKAGYPMT